ncbi:hypothetical protein DYB25_004224 [Aphanomyces astaci]|uniref:BAH domain-containing protein n=1 Tax=Aphanomyces astaci TaxID=112090 RepID=A0A396ZU53_APHAT|nr:hypothetical protein DYB25_004224 [Aphanomyces astaci]
MELEDGSAASAAGRRAALPREARNNVVTYDEAQLYMENSYRSPKRAKPTTTRSGATLATVELDIDLEIRKGKLEVGDCVLVSHNDEEYVALVSTLHSSDGNPVAADSRPKLFTGIWYFRPEDVAKEALDVVDGGVLENEVFQSVEKDTNALEHVLGKCQVVSELDLRDRQNILRLNQHPIDADEIVFVCRYKYDMKKQTLAPLSDPYEVHHGLGRSEPSVGGDYQADGLPPCTRPPPPSPIQGPTHVWSPSTMTDAPYAFKEFMHAVDSLRFGIGAVVKIYIAGGSSSSPGSSSTSTSPVRVSTNPLVGGAMCRAMICKVLDKHSIVVSAAATGGTPVEVLKSSSSSMLTDDRALTFFHEARRDAAAALAKCANVFREQQVEEKALFRRELQLHLTKA